MRVPERNHDKVISSALTPSQILIYHNGEPASIILSAGLQEAGYGPYTSYDAKSTRLPESYSRVSETHTRAVAQDYFRKVNTSHSCLVLNVVRTPLANVISESFRALGGKSDLLTDREVFSEFHTSYLPHRGRQDKDWFTNFAKDVGVDLFSRQADVTDQGFAYFSTSHSGCSVLLLRYEDLSNWDIVLNRVLRGWSKQPKKRLSPCRLFEPGAALPLLHPLFKNKRGRGRGTIKLRCLAFLHSQRAGSSGN